MYDVVIWKIVIRSCHNFAHAMTAELSWHVQNYDMIGMLESELEQKAFTQDFLKIRTRFQ